MAEKKGGHSKRKNSSSAPSPGSTLVTNRRMRETPYQDINRIRRNILAVRETKGSLLPEDCFMDPSFASDMTSLAYVYSGDDKYEKAIFKRPHVSGSVSRRLCLMSRPLFVAKTLFDVETFFHVKTLFDVKTVVCRNCFSCQDFV